MGPQTIGDIPFVERPAQSLLHLDVDRDLPSRDYAGFGWCRVPSLWLESVTERCVSEVYDAVILALHSADDSEALADDIELEFECPGGDVAVLASAFLAHWLPRLPSASAIVLALCNPHRASLRAPSGVMAPLHYGLGEVTSWREMADDGTEKMILSADTWCQSPSATTRNRPTSRFIY